MPVKAVRDKVVVHAGPPHFQFVTYPSNHDMGLFLALDGRQPWTDYPHASSVLLSARRLIDNVRKFLNWYSEYATQALQRNGKLETKASNHGMQAPGSGVTPDAKAQPARRPARG